MKNNKIKTNDYYLHNGNKYQCTGTWATEIQYQISALKYGFHKTIDCIKL